MTNEAKNKRQRFEKRVAQHSALNDELIPLYDQVSINGAALVDGHHVFINIAKSIDRLNQNPEKFARRLGASISKIYKAAAILKDNKWTEFDPKRIASIYGQIIWRVSDAAEAHMLHNVIGDERKLVQKYTLLSTSGYDDNASTSGITSQKLSDYPPAEFVCADTRTERWLFDAKMPPIEEVKKNLLENFQYWENKDKWKSDNIVEHLDLLKLKKWGFFESQLRGSIQMPYEVKNQVIDNLSKDWEYGQFNLSTQTRKISGFTGYVENREKGVDTKLVIKGCELATQPDIDWVWLVTADGDHAPLIEHLIASGKEVFLTSLSQPSKALLDALASPENYMHFDDLCDYKEMWLATGKRHLLSPKSGAGLDFMVLTGCYTDHFANILLEHPTFKGADLESLLWGLPDSKQ